MPSWCRTWIQAGIDPLHQRPVPGVVVERPELGTEPYPEQGLGAIIEGLLERLERSVLLAQCHIDLSDVGVINIAFPRSGFELRQYAPRVRVVSKVGIANRGLVVGLTSKLCMCLHRGGTSDAV